jgi:uncharacterized protein with HEPN domain
LNHRDFDRLELIQSLIAHLRRRLANLSERAFYADKDEIDLTAFRLSAMGEACYKLSDELKLRNSRIDWIAIYGMRNVIVHDYEGIKPERLWKVITENLDEMEELCRVELGSS